MMGLAPARRPSPSGARPPVSKLVLGLGNPGQEYARHRHNVGFQCVDLVAGTLGVRFSQAHRVARLAQGQVDRVAVVLAKPSAFVNRSGEAAAALLQRYELEAVDMIVVYDDLDLPLGRIRVRERGGSGGHNGLKSIIAALHRQDFPRVRVGIGRPPDWDSALRGAAREEAIVRWVLSNFTPEEEAVMEGVRPRAAAAVRCLLAEGIATAMNRYNADQVLA